MNVLIGGRTERPEQETGGVKAELKLNIQVIAGNVKDFLLNPKSGREAIEKF